MNPHMAVYLLHIRLRYGAMLRAVDDGNKNFQASIGVVRESLRP